MLTPHMPVSVLVLYLYIARVLPFMCSLHDGTPHHPIIIFDSIREYPEIPPAPHPAAVTLMVWIYDIYW